LVIVMPSVTTSPRS
jgi:hypothetical protein